MNKVILLGRLTKEPDLQFAANSGKAICKFSMAVARPFKKGESDFINCIAFGKTGETIAQYVQKGHQLAITGAIKTGSYDNKQGNKVYTTDILVDSFEFIQGQKQNNNQAAAPMQDLGSPVFGDTPFEGIEPIDYGNQEF